MDFFDKLIEIKPKIYLEILGLLMFLRYLVDHFKEAFILWNYTSIPVVICKILNFIISIISIIGLRKIFNIFLVEHYNFFNSKYIINPIPKLIKAFDILLAIAILISISDVFGLISKELTSDLRMLLVISVFAPMLWEIFLKKHRVLKITNKFIKDTFSNFKIPEFISEVFSLDFKFLLFFICLKNLVKALNIGNIILRKRELFLNNHYLFSIINFFILIFSIILLKRLLDISVYKLNKNLNKSGSKDNMVKSNFLFVVPLISNAGKILLAVIFVNSFLNILGYSIFSFTSQLPKFISSLGILGIGLSFLAKDTVSNFIAGIFILTDSPFAIGDRIQVEEIEGEVEEIGIRTTKLRTRFNTIVTIPNSLLTSQAVTSFRKYGREIRIFYEIVVSYKNDIKKVKEILMKASKNSETIIKNPEPIIHLSSFDSFSLKLTMIFWIEDILDKFPACNDLNTIIIEEFKREGIKIPYPIYGVNIKEDEKLV